MPGRSGRRGREGFVSRPPFERENTLAVSHGARSVRLVAPVAAEIGEVLPVVAPWTRSDAFAGARGSLSWVEAQLVLVRAFVDEHGPLDEDGKPRAAAVFLDKLEARASSLRGELALTPQSLAKLLGSLAQVASAGHDEDALDALRREGAAILQARQLAAVPEQMPDGDEAG